MRNQHQNRTTLADVRRAAIDALYYATYQVEAEAELGDGIGSAFFQEWLGEQARAIQVLHVLLPEDEVEECQAAAQRIASERVNGA